MRDVENKCCRETPCRKDSCRLCLPCGLMVADVVAAYPDGLSQQQIAVLLQRDKVVVQRSEKSGLLKVKASVMPKHSPEGHN